MPLFARRPRLGERAVAALHLARKEGVLAFQPLDEGTIVATDHRIAVLDGDDRLVAARAWHEVDAASWDQERSVLRVTWVDGAGPWAFGVRAPDRDLMTIVRARVQSTLLDTQSTKVGGRTVRVALRRSLDDGRLFLQHQYGPGLRADDPRVRAAVAGLEAVLRDDAGLAPGWTGEASAG